MEKFKAMIFYIAKIRTLNNLSRLISLLSLRLNLILPPLSSDQLMCREVGAQLQEMFSIVIEMIKIMLILAGNEKGGSNKRSKWVYLKSRFKATLFICQMISKGFAYHFIRKKVKVCVISRRYIHRKEKLTILRITKHCVEETRL